VVAAPTAGATTTEADTTCTRWMSSHLVKPTGNGGASFTDSLSVESAGSMAVQQADTVAADHPCPLCGQKELLTQQQLHFPLLCLLTHHAAWTASDRLCTPCSTHCKRLTFEGRRSTKCLACQFAESSKGPLRVCHSTDQGPRESGWAGKRSKKTAEGLQ